MILVADGSHYKTPPGSAKLKAAGISGLMWKATQGDSFFDPSFEGALADANAAGMPFMAFHYVDAGSKSVESEVAWVKAHVPPIALVPDIEADSGAISRSIEVYQGLIEAGFHIPFVYLPEWYWSENGSPALSGLPPLWNSHYVSGSGNPASLMSSVPISWWAGYGGNNPMMLQFTDAGSVNGSGCGDFSLFSGDSDQFVRMVTPGATVIPIAPPVTSYPEIRDGSTGQIVKDLQSFMNRVFPAYSKLVVDGDFGPLTEAVVKEFQSRSKLSVDGIVGPNTWSALVHDGFSG